MYLVNKQRVSAPVLGLIDLASEKAGYDPIPAVKTELGKPMLQQKPVAATQPALDDDDLEDAAMV
jgi:hypothetical protein